MELELKNNNNPKIKGIYKFFCWCSGARLYLLKKCPTDFNVYFGIGMIVFLTGVMATMSGSYAFYTIFENLYLSIAFGVFWGTLIFFFDWYLVASLRKENKVIKEILTASPRIILALFLAIVISRPLELKLFEKEINGQIEKMSQQKYNEYKGIVSESFDEIEELKQQNNKYQNRLSDLLAQRNTLFELIIEEAEGRSPTSTSGKGSVYREKKAEFDKVDAMYENEKTRLYPLIDGNNRVISQLSEQKLTQLNSGDKTLKKANGFLARIEAYNQLSKENEGIRFTGLFIMFLFICIETGPMFVKLISRRGAYDELILLEETRNMAESRIEIEQIKERTTRIIEIERLKSKSRLEEESENSRDFAKQVMEAQSEIGKERINRWKIRELNKLDDSLKAYNPSIDELIEEAKIAMKPN